MIRFRTETLLQQKEVEAFRKLFNEIASGRRRNTVCIQCVNGQPLHASLNSPASHHRILLRPCASGVSDARRIAEVAVIDLGRERVQVEAWEDWDRR